MPWTRNFGILLKYWGHDSHCERCGAKLGVASTIEGLNPAVKVIVAAEPEYWMQTWILVGNQLPCEYEICL